MYGELGDSEAVARRGFELITSDLEWEEPSPQHQRRLKPAKKGRGRKDDAAAVAAAADDDDDDDPLGATAELAKESWEVRTTTNLVIFMAIFCLIFGFFLLFTLFFLLKKNN